MKVTIELHDPDDMVMFAKFLTKLDKRRNPKPVTGGPEPETSPQSGAGKPDALSQLRAQQASCTAQGIARFRGTSSRTSP